MPSDAAAPVGAAHHLHPATLLFTLGTAAWRLLVPALAVLFFARGGREEIWLAILFGPAAIAAVLRYATFRYAFGPEDLVVRHGLFFRNERHVPYVRIQSVDLVQNPLHRFLRVAEVRVQTASGEQAEASLRVLSLDAAEAMRARVARARSEATPAAVEGPSSPPGAFPAAGWRRLAAMPVREIVLYGLISNRGTVVVGAALGVLWQISVWSGGEGAFPFDPRAIAESLARLAGRPGGAALAVLAILAVVLALRLLSIAYAFVAFHGFALETSDGTLRTATGLFTKLSATIPRHRIQLLSLTETPLHRLFRRVSIRVATAGGHGGETERTQREDWLVPLLPRAGARDLIGEVLPEIDLGSLSWTPAHRATFRRLCVRRLVVAAVLLGGPLYALGSAGSVLGAALVVWIVLASRLSARAYGWALGSGYVAFRSGFWKRATSAAPFSKIQAVASLRSPFDRRHGTATVEVDTAGAGGALHRIRIPFVPEARARELAEALAAGAAGTEFRW